MFKTLRLSILAVATLALTGCLLPDAPKDSSFKNLEVREFYNVYTMDRKTESTKTVRPTKKNVILITADTYLQEYFRPQLEAAYGKKDQVPTLNELAWWAYQPLLRDIYNKAIYLNVNQAKHSIIVDAIGYMERQSLPYDLIILSHGIPNHLTTGEVGYFMSFKEIQELGQLKKLNLVFLQACFGESLQQDWLNAGAKRVMAYQGFNRNFFFIGVFLDHHRFYDEDGAFFTANRDMEKELNEKKLYKELIARGLGKDVSGYLAEVEEPLLFPEKYRRRAR